jgi:hypothetical protein
MDQFISVASAGFPLTRLANDLLALVLRTIPASFVVQTMIGTSH